MTPITFKQAGSEYKTVRYAPGIKAWMDHDGGVRNWVVGCVGMFAGMERVLSVSCAVPDQWRGEMGDVIHMEKFETKGGREIRVME